jgi:2'-5' RNA ligase
MTQSSIPCDIVVLPSDELAAKAILASKNLKLLGSLFSLEIGKYFPHSSIYMLQLSTDAIGQVKHVLADIAQETKSLHLEANGYYQKEGFIDAGYTVSGELRNLQEKILSAINTLRDGMREKDKARMVEATGLALKNYQDYGYKYVGELFRPHITLTRFTEEQPTAEQLLSNVSDFNGTFTKIGLFEMGDNGTCIRQIGSWNLQ